MCRWRSPAAASSFEVRDPLVTPQPPPNRSGDVAESGPGVMAFEFESVLFMRYYPVSLEFTRDRQPGPEHTAG